MPDIIEEGLLRQFNINPTSIERWILLGVLRSIRFYRSVRQNVCARQTDGRLRQDFLTPRYNQLYAAADRFWRLLDRSAMDRDMEIPRHLLATLLQDDLELGKLDEPDYQLLMEEMEQVFYSMAVVPAPLLKGIHGPLKVWLDLRMATMAVNTAHMGAQTKRLDMAKLREVVSTYGKASSMEGQRVVKAATALDGRRTFYRRIGSGLDDLDKAMGGGFGRGEAALIAGANGAGKTVLGCQFAVAFAKQGLKVAYVTTEQTPVDLTYRMLSGHASVQFEHFTNREEMRELSRRDMVELANLPPLFQTDPDAAIGLASFRTEVLPNVEFVDWSGGAAPVVQDSFDSAMDAVAESLGAPASVVIFDWIGGAMERGKDKENLRHYYYDAVNYLVNYAKSHPSVAILIMAQIDKAKADKAHMIKMIHLAECKSMSDNVSTFIGISSKNDSRKQDGAMVEEIAPMQFLNVNKARFAPPGFVPVLRQFTFQRFASHPRD